MATILTPLIKGQTIRIDNHQQGAGTENDWSKEGVHFHKSCNKTKGKFDIIISEFFNSLYPKFLNI